MGGGALRAELATQPVRPPPRDLLTSVARALEVLELVATAPGPLPAKAVASRLGISLGTAYHVLHTLEHGGYVVRLGQGCFGLGLKVCSLARLFTNGVDLLPAVRPALATLAEQAGEDAYLAVMRGGEIVVVDVVEGSATLHVGDLGVGFPEVAHTTALGKVLLADARDDDIDHYLDAHRLVRMTARTLVDRRHVKRHLGAVRELGVARDLEEFADGVCCVAFPVRGRGGATLASIGISVPAGRWRAEGERLTGLCAEAAEAGSTALSAARPPRPEASTANGGAVSKPG
jgi:DNA-binding IclR family transcriptional regulator